jgi:hypothetical protein
LILKFITDLTVAFFDLVEDEGCLLQSRVLKVLVCALFAIGTLCIALAGLYFLMHGLHFYLVGLMGELYASLSVGGILVLAAGILAWQAKRTLN